MKTYISSQQHLLGKELDAPLVSVAGSSSLQRENVLQIRLEESAVSAVGHESIGLLRNLAINVVVLLAILVQKDTSEVGGIGHILDLIQLIWEREVDQILDTGEVDLSEALLEDHGAESLAVSPSVSIRNAQQVIVYKAIRNDGQLGARGVDLANTNTHGVEALDGNLLCLVRQNAQDLVLLVGRLEGEGRQAHQDLLLGHDELVNNRQELGDTSSESVHAVVEFVKGILEDDGQDLSGDLSGFLSSLGELSALQRSEGRN